MGWSSTSDVTIAEHDTILLDTETASLKTLEIRGTLIADPETDFWVTAANINVYGTLRVGWISAPYTRRGGFTLTGAKVNYTARAEPLLAFKNDGVSRSIRAFDGAHLELHGNPPTPYTRLNDNAEMGATVLTVDSLKGWQVGDEIAISPTTFPSTSQTNYRRIVAIDADARKVTIDEGLSYARWGKIQYMTDQGVSLQPGVFNEMKAHPDTADTLDERAVIIHLSRNIVIESPNDTDWQQGHGVHVMWMGVSTQVQLNGVEVRRAGQAGALGRYPLHAHMQSYNLPNGLTEPSDGTFLGDATGVFVRNCAVHQSVNPAVVIHGTCGARYVHNVASDILGHAFFFEDGSEQHNHFIGNVVLNVRAPVPSNRLLKVDESASGIWYSNGMNHLRHNIVGDIRNGVGLWNAFTPRPMPVYTDIVKSGSITLNVYPPGTDEFRARHNPVAESWTFTATSSTEWSVVGSVSGAQPAATTGTTYDNNIIRVLITGTASVGTKVTFRIDAYVGGCLGQSRNVDIHPQYTFILDYYNNTAFACARTGAMTDLYAIDEVGNTGSRGFVSTNDSRPAPDYNSPRLIPTHFVRHQLWMNEGGAYANRVNNPLYTGWILADNYRTDLRGATQFGKIERALFVGHSLNTLEPKLALQGRHALTTYHFSLDFHDLTLYNYPPLPTEGVLLDRKLLEMPGAVESWDLYLHSIETGPLKIRNWRQFNVTQFERTPPPNIEHIYPINGGGPDVERRYWTLSGAIYDYQGILAGRAGDYIIFDYPFLTHGLTNSRRVGTPTSKTLATSDRFYGLSVKDTDLGDPAYEPVTFVRLDNNFNEVSRWVIEDGRNAAMLGNMRHASAVKGGIYRVFNHVNPTPNQDIFRLDIAFGNQVGDQFIVGMPWSASVVPVVYFGRNNLEPISRRPYPGDFQFGWHKILTPVNSRTDLLATPQSYWRDLGTNQLWFNHQGNFTTFENLAVTIRPAL